MIREAVTAFSRRQKDPEDPKSDVKPAEPKVETVEAKPVAVEAKPVAVEAKLVAVEAKPVAVEAKLVAVEAKPAAVEPAVEARPEPKPPAVTAESPRVRMATLVPLNEPPIGKPPAMPDTRTEKSAIGDVEDPTRMPSPREIPEGNPEDLAAPPGQVPPGDSRSLRRAGEFALVYRLGTYVISRFGTVGQRGQWRVVEYPTSASASHSYAKECSRFVTEGFSDYRA